MNIPSVSCALDAELDVRFGMQRERKRERAKIMNSGKNNSFQCLKF